MSQPSPKPKRPSGAQMRYLLVAWVSLTLIVGGFIFVLVFWATGGFERAEAPGPTAEATAPVQGTPVDSAGPTSVPPTTAAPGQEADPTEQAVKCAYPPEPASGFLYGVQMNPFISDNQYWMGVVRNLGMNWIKVQVRWADLEPAEGQINWPALRDAMSAACLNGLRVMFSVVTAPEWTKAEPLGIEAPPDNPKHLANFIAKVLNRYGGRVGAIEVWNEQNLEREWNTAEGISPARYIELLQVTYERIKSKDPNVLVIAGALSPTGINCRVGPFPGNCAPDGRIIIMDDASYLQEFVRLGGLNYADCVGTHSNGTNLPPSADGANPPADRSGYTFAGPWDNPHYSWALNSQINTYWEIVGGAKPLCVTEFGYASPVEGAYPPNFGFAADVTEEEQAQYLVEAFNLMRESGKVHGAWLFNLDYGPKGGDPAEDDNVIFSLLYRDGTARPAFGAVGAMPKP